jgi:MFS family permease
VTRFEPREWSVLLPLCLVGFFTNYDTGLLALASPVIADGLDVSVATFGIGVALIRLGALGSVVTLRLADRWGRRPMLLVSVLAFTVLTGATAAAAGLVVFVVLQVLARVFLSTEETLAGVVLTEELRPEHRGAGIGMLGIISTGGFGLVALLLLPWTAPRSAGGCSTWWPSSRSRSSSTCGATSPRRGPTRSRRPRSASGSRGGRTCPGAVRHLRRLLLVLTAVGMLATTSFFFAAELAQEDYGWKGCSPSWSSRPRPPPCSATSWAVA